MKRILTLLAVAIASLALAAPSLAATVNLFGGATRDNGTIRLVSDLSDTTTANDFSGISITGLGGLTLGQLDVLAAEFNVTDDGCGGGSPRFVLILDDGRAVNVAFGPAPSFTGCAPNTWISSGNLVGQLEGCRWHVTSPASLADACLTAEELQALAGRTITEIRVVVDSGWFFADREQTVLLRNVIVNDTVVAPTVTNGRLNPARACRAMQTAMGATAFSTTFGTNANRRNAFGKCVSRMAKAKQSGNLDAAQLAILNVVNACKASGATGAALTTCIVQQVRTVLAETAPAVATAKAPSNGKGKKGKGKGK